MTDKELLELAAKANGDHIDDWNGDTPVMYFWDGDPQNPERNYRYWNPLEDDGDAFRLAVKMGISILSGTYKVVCEIILQEDSGNIAVHEQYGSDEYAATRRAIVSAAAELGRNME